MGQIRTLVLTSIVGMAASQATADDLRCGADLVSSGASTYEVRATCGEPDATAQRVEYRTERVYLAVPCAAPAGTPTCGRYVERTVEVVIDEWTYDRGPNEFIRYAVFEQNRLRDVVLGDRGHKRP